MMSFACQANTHTNLDILPLRDSVWGECEREVFFFDEWSVVLWVKRVFVWASLSSLCFLSAWSYISSHFDQSLLDYSSRRNHDKVATNDAETELSVRGWTTKHTCLFQMNR